MPAASKQTTPRQRKSTPAKPVATDRDNIGFLPSLDSLHYSTVFDRTACLWPLLAEATVLDFYYAIDPKAASFCIGVAINGKAAPLSTIPAEGDALDFYVSEQRSPSKAWLTFTTSPARELIRHELGLPLSPLQQTVFDAASKTAADLYAHRQAHRSQQATQPIPQPAKGYIQPGRDGKKLIGAYIDKADAARLKSLLAAQGVTVQEFFTKAIAQALASDVSHAERERLIEAEVERVRARLRASL